MPHLEVVCLFCGGIIRDLLLECVPQAKRGALAYALLMELNPGVAFPCPYCSTLLGFDENHKLRAPASGWPVLRYGLAELQLRKNIDGEPSTVSLQDWGRRHRWLEAGTHYPLSEYSYAEQAAADETVP